MSQPESQQPPMQVVAASITVKDGAGMVRPYEGTFPDQFYRVLAPGTMTVEGTITPSTHTVEAKLIEAGPNDYPADSIIRYDPNNQTKWRATWNNVKRQDDQTLEIKDVQDDQTQSWIVHGRENYANNNNQGG